MVLDATLLNTQQYKVRIKGKVSNPGKWVLPSLTPRCSSYWKGSFRVTLDNSRQLIYIYVCVCVCVCGAFNRFSDFFVQTFKIAVESWKFSMLLQYNLWDDGPIFMISGSNEQLQQQLEYTLLKPDCHSWSISKMQSDTLEERYAIKLCFKLGKKCHRNV